MYLAHYKFKEKPFQITTDPKFVWLGEKHQEALSILKYGIMENKGFLLLTGEVGTGKTVLINCLTTLLDIENIVATVPNPDLNILDFFNFLADGFNFNKKYGSKGDFLIDLKNFLHASHRKNQKVLLIVDEAHRLGHELLEEIRLLSNIELHDRKLINIFFVGQNEINQKLLENRNRAVAQRIAVRYNIDPLTETETGAYIRHRLEVAGCNKEIFKSSAIHEIYSFAEGIPRLINIICDHSLLTGYALGKKSLDARIIRECANELKIPVQKIKNDETIKDEKDLISILEDIRLEISKGLGQAPQKKVAGKSSKIPVRQEKTERARPAEKETNRKVSEEKNGARPEGKNPPIKTTPASRTLLVKIFYFVFAAFLVNTGFQFLKITRSRINLSGDWKTSDPKSTKNRSARKSKR